MRDASVPTAIQEELAVTLPGRILTNLYGHTADSYEIKSIEAEYVECGFNGLVFLLVVTGLIGSDGTMAEVFTWDRRHIAIGPRGGLHLMNARLKNVRGRRVFWELTR